MKHITQEQIRAAGGIVHRDGNIFFTNIDQLNAALAQPASAPNACDLIDASSYASSLGFLSGTSNWAAAMQRHLAGVLQPASAPAAPTGAPG